MAHPDAGQELKDAWLQFHAFIVMGGFRLGNLLPTYHDRFREVQQRVINAVRNAERISAELAQSKQPGSVTRTALQHEIARRVCKSEARGVYGHKTCREAMTSPQLWCGECLAKAAVEVDRLSNGLNTPPEDALDARLSRAQLVLRNGYNDDLSRAVAEARDRLTAFEAPAAERAEILSADLRRFAINWRFRGYAPSFICEAADELKRLAAAVKYK